jgi:hypothetical protein
MKTKNSWDMAIGEIKSEINRLEMRKYNGAAPWAMRLLCLRKELTRREEIEACLEKRNERTCD